MHTHWPVHPYEGDYACRVCGVELRQSEHNRYVWVPETET